MEGWKKLLLEQLPLDRRLIFVHDREDLLSDEELVGQLKAKEISIFTVGDRAEFREHYEIQLEDPGEKWLYRYVGEGPFTFPFDMMAAHGIVELSLETVFPALSLAVLRELETDVLDVLAKAAQGLPGILSHKETCHFIIKKVYKLPYDTVETELEWIGFLIQVFDHSYPLTKVLREHIVEAVAVKSDISQELLSLISSKEAFLGYLQQEWQQFIHSHTGDASLLREKDPGQEQRHRLFHYLKGRIQHYFIEGKLIPVKITQASQLPLWAKIGVSQKPVRPMEDLEHLAGKINQLLALEKRHYKTWVEIASLYGQMKNIELQSGEGQQPVEKIKQKVNRLFKDWMLTGYGTLAGFSPYNKPVMVHHILPHMQYKREGKQALIVLDGMSFVQWKQIKQYVETDFILAEEGVFAWVPTITEISRQAIFEGRIPRGHLALPEEKAWQQFWNRDGVNPLHITFENHLAQGALEETALNALQKPNTKKAAIILRNIDVLIHGAIQGHQGMYAELEVWLRTNYLRDLLTKLVESNYLVYLTSDHGNTESTGIGRPHEGVLVNTSGERVRIYTGREFRDHAAKEYPSIPWSNEGLRRDHYYLLAEAGEAFTVKNKQVVSHGGMTLEEVVVPFVKIQQRR